MLPGATGGLPGVADRLPGVTGRLPSVTGPPGAGDRRRPALDRRTLVTGAPPTSGQRLSRLLAAAATGEEAGGSVAAEGAGLAPVRGPAPPDVPGSLGSTSSLDPATPAPSSRGVTATTVGAPGVEGAGAGLTGGGVFRSGDPGVTGSGADSVVTGSGADSVVTGSGADSGGAGAADSEVAGSTTLARLAAAAFDPGRPGLRALAAVAAVVVAGAAALAWWSRPRVEPVPPSPVVTVAPVATPSTPAEIVVAVTGLVHRPGLVRLAPGARVADAVDAAGGALPEADLSQLNLARRLADGELVAVGVPPPPGEGSGPAGESAKVNLNTATQADLETLPGIGPALAQRILAWREANGGFSSVEQLREVSGIGEVRFAELRELVTV